MTDQIISTAVFGSPKSIRQLTVNGHNETGAQRTFQGYSHAQNPAIEGSRAIIETPVISPMLHRGVVGTFLRGIYVETASGLEMEGRHDIACYEIDANRYMLAVLRQALVGSLYDALNEYFMPPGYISTSE